MLNICIALILAASPATQAAPVTADSLKLLPAAAKTPHEIGPALTEKTWTLRGSRNIIGQGTDQTLQFTDFKKDGSCKVEHSTIVYPRTGQGEPKITSTHGDCRIQGALMQMDDDVRTFALVGDQTLVLNAVVPVGPKQWYFATVEHFNSGDIRQRIWEYRLDFQEEPAHAAQGKVVVWRRLGDEVKQIDATFEITTQRDLGDIRLKIGDATFERMMLAPDRKYATLDGPTGRALVFSAPTPPRRSPVH